MIKAILNLFKPKVKAVTQNPQFKEVEWAFQFNDDEPILFQRPNNKEKYLCIIVRNKLKSKYVFKDGKGNEFKVFARARTSETFNKVV
jgi:hypothetical protein